jgi:hypothetical protein
MITMIKEINEAYETLSPTLKYYHDTYCWTYEQAYVYYKDHWAYQDRSDKEIVMMAIDHVLTTIQSLKNGTYGAY